MQKKAIASRNHFFLPYHGAQFKITFLVFAKDTDIPAQKVSWILALEVLSLFQLLVLVKKPIQAVIHHILHAFIHNIEFVILLGNP